MTEKRTTKVITVRGQKVTIYYYELFLELYKEWRKTMAQEEIEDLLLS